MSVQFPPGIDQQRWTPPANVIKILLMGEGGVGRTTLALKYVSGVFCNNTQMTIGIQYHLKNIELDGKAYALSLWDLAGQDRFRFIHPTYARGAKGAIFFYDMTRRSTMGNIEEWVNIARTYDPNLPVMMCGLKIDLDDRGVGKSEAMDFLQLLGLFDYMEPNTKSGEGVELVFETLVRKIVARQDAGDVPALGPREIAIKKQIADRFFDRMSDQQFELYEKAVQSHPKNSSNWDECGSKRWLRGNLKGAIEAFEKALQINPELGRLWIKIGDIRYALKDWKGADEAYEKALEINPDKVAIWNNLGLTRDILKPRPKKVTGAAMVPQPPPPATAPVKPIASVPKVPQPPPPAMAPVKAIPSVAKVPQTPPAKPKVERQPNQAPFDKKTRLFGMIKARKKITIRDAVDIVGMEKRDIEVLIYDLVGEGKLEGEFQEGDVFLITSDVDAAIRNLDNSFRAWKAGGEKRAGKKD